MRYDWTLVELETIGYCEIYGVSEPGQPVILIRSDVPDHQLLAEELVGRLNGAESDADAGSHYAFCEGYR